VQVQVQVQVLVLVLVPVPVPVLMTSPPAPVPGSHCFHRKPAEQQPPRTSRPEGPRDAAFAVVAKERKHW